MKKLIIIIVATLCILTGLNSPSAEVLRIGEMDLPQTYEPITVIKPVERRLTSLMYEGLIRKTYAEDASGNLTYQYVPALAEEFWPVDEKGQKTDDPYSLSWRFKLRDKVLWKKPDGMKSLFTANDVKYTMDVLKNPRTTPKDELLSAYLKDRPAADGTNVVIPAIEIIDPFLLQINLNHAAYSPRRFFCFKVVKHDPDSKSWDRKNPTPYRFTPVGTGPYVMEKRRSRKITFKKNEHYWGGAENIDSVSFKRFDDRKSMLQACFFNYNRQDAIDIIPSLLPDEIAAFEEDPRHYIADLNLYNFYFIGFNFAENGALNAIINKLPSAKRDEISLGIREAMLIGFDRENTLKVYGKAPGEILEGPYPAGSWAYSSQDKKKRRYAPAEAKATLAAIGFRGGRYEQNKRIVLKFRLSYRQGDTYYERVAAKFADAMDKIGIEIIPVGVPGPMWQKTIYQQRDFDMVLDRYLYREDMDISPFFSSSASVLGYRDRLLGEYLAKIKNSQLRKDQLQGLYQAMDRFLWNNTPVIFLWSLNQCVGVRSNLAENIVDVRGGGTIEPIRAIDGYDFFGNIPRWRIQKP